MEELLIIHGVNRSTDLKINNNIGARILAGVVEER